MDPGLKRAALVAAISFLTNLPLGYLRGGVRPGLKRFPRKSPEWWSALRWTLLYIHLSIPIVATARRHWGLQPWYLYVPVFIALALAAQALGEAVRKRRDAPRALEHETGEMGS